MSTEASSVLVPSSNTKAPMEQGALLAAFSIEEQVDREHSAGTLGGAGMLLRLEGRWPLLFPCHSRDALSVGRTGT